MRVFRGAVLSESDIDVVFFELLVGFLLESFDLFG